MDVPGKVLASWSHLTPGLGWKVLGLLYLEKNWSLYGENLRVANTVGYVLKNLHLALLKNY